MTDLTALPALLARVEAATGPNRDLDYAILNGLKLSMPDFVTPAPRFTSSLDDTMLLIDGFVTKWDILSGHNWAHSIDPPRRAYFCSMIPRFKPDGSLSDEDRFNVVGRGHTEVLARLAALLRSMIEEEGK